MKVEREGDQTKLIHSTTYALMPNFRPLGWLLEKLVVHKSMIQNLNESVQNCKQMVEMQTQQKLAER